LVDVTFYGAVSRIGGNKTLIEDSDTKIFLDFGINYSKEDLFFEFPLLRPSCKEDLFKLNLLPIIPGLYQNQGYYPIYKDDGTFSVAGESEQKQINAIFLSHAHMDHYGYFGLLRHDIPLYMSDITKKLIELREDVGSKNWNSNLENSDIKEIEKNKNLQINDFNINRYDVDHSILGASGYIIHINNITIAYTGDFRFHGYRKDLTEDFLSNLKNQHIDILITEGTRVTDKMEQDESTISSKSLETEQDVYEKCHEIVSNEDKLIIYDASYADLDRVRTLWKIAKKTGRKLVLDSKKAFILLYLNVENQLVKDIPQLGDFLIYLNRHKFNKRGKIYNGLTNGHDVYVESFEYYRQNHEAQLTVKQQINSKLKKKSKTLEEYQKQFNNPYLFEIDESNFIWGPHGREKILRNPNEYIVYTPNGMQTMLQIKPANQPINGTYIYGKAEPFKEEMILSFKRLQNWLRACNFKLEYAHTSGHVNRKRMGEFLEEVRPSKLFPIHTEQPKVFFEVGYKKTQEIILPEYGKKYSFKSN